MSEENKAVVHRFYEALDQKHYDIYEELCTPDFVSHFPGSAEPQNRDMRKHTSRIFYEAFPDLVHIIDHIIAESDTVAFRGSARGTHEGVFQNLQPTEKTITFDLTRFYHMVDGKIAEEWVSADLLGLMRQLGMKLVAEKDIEF